jgi:sec-independent protein translocase protein TatB
MLAKRYREAAVFDNLNGWEFFGLLLIALLIFGDRLPKAISDGLRMLRNLRQMATNATGDLSRELGTDIKIEDLNPKTFVRKHLLSEEDELAIRKPFQGVLDDVKRETDGLREETRGIAKAMDHRMPPSASFTTPAPAVPAARTYDDAT